jgi:hypothetical protein
MNTKHAQAGVGFVGFILIMAMVIGLAVVGMKVVPAYTEFMTIERTVKKVSREMPAGAPLDVKSAFDRYAQIDSISSISGKDLLVEKGPNGQMISFAYNKKIPLVGPASILLEFKGNSEGK